MVVFYLPFITEGVEMATASLKLDENIFDRLGKLAETNKRTKHSLMVEAVESYIEKAEAREAYIQEARASHEHYVETGLHLTNEEVMEWLQKIASGKQAEFPKSHL